MKRRVAPILTFTIGLVLVSGLAYAANKKIKTRPTVRIPDPTHEEEALKAALLEDLDEQELKLLRISDTVKIVNAKSHKKEDQFELDK